MENPTPFDLKEAIRRWQQNLGTSPAFKADDLEELASHLHASVQRLKATGLSEEEAFLMATRRIGEHGPLEREFAKLNPELNCSLPLFLFWIVAGMYFLQVAYSLVLGIVYLRRGLMMREAARVAGESHNQSWRFLFNPGNDPLWWCVPTLTIVIVFVLILGARLATGTGRPSEVLNARSALR